MSYYNSDMSYIPSDLYVDLHNILEHTNNKDIDILKSTLEKQSVILNFKYYLKNIFTGNNPTSQDLIDKKVGVYIYDSEILDLNGFSWIGFHPGLIYQIYPFEEAKFINSTRNAHLFINEKLAENPDFEYVRKAMKERFFNR